MGRPSPRASWVAPASAAAVGVALLVSSVLPERRLHVADRRGVVWADPSGLARAAGVPLDVYALASCMQSEESTDRGRLAVGRAAWNAVRGRRDKIVPLLLSSGHLGSQTVNPYASTSRPPTSRTLALAGAVAEGRVPDFVDGATQWDNPELQDRLHALYLANPRKYPKYRRSSEDVAARRRDAGAREVRVPGVEKTRFWTRRS